MAKRVLAWFGLLAACASFGGCGKTGDGDAPVEQRDLATAVANVVCASLGSCCKASSFAFDEALCRRQEAAELDDELNGYDPKNVIYDAKAAGDCLAAIADAVECGELTDSRANTACTKIFTGKLAPGEVCTDSKECARSAKGGSAYCETAAEGTVVTVCLQSLGSASVPGKAGQACNGSCEGDSCSIVTEPLPGDTATPTPSVICYQKDGLYCGPTATCEALVGLGRACSDFSACTKDLFCDSVTAVCTSPRELGEPCQGSDACKSGYCTDDTEVCAERAVTATTCSTGKLSI